MWNKWEKVLDCMRVVDNIEELELLLLEAAHLMNFDNFAIGVRTHTPISNPKTLLINNYPTDWKLEYTENNYIEVDPTVAHGLQTMEPVIWTDNFFARSEELWERARSYDLRHGVAQSIIDSSCTSLLSISRSGEKVTNEDLNRDFKIIFTVNMIANQRLRLKTTNFPDLGEGLTNREKEIMKWTADGKTSFEISVILGIKERTVNFHINNTITKLGTMNKTAAVVKAIMNDLLV